jgi:hypothetical protein
MVGNGSARPQRDNCSKGKSARMIGSYRSMQELTAGQVDHAFYFDVTVCARKWEAGRGPALSSNDFRDIDDKINLKLARTVEIISIYGLLYRGQV